MKIGKLQNRLRQEDLHTELVFLDLHRKRGAGDVELDACFDICYGDMVFDAIEEYNRVHLVRRRRNITKKSRADLHDAIRNAFWKYLSSVERHWRRLGKWSMHRQWRECLSCVYIDNGQRQTLRHLLEWFVNEYIRWFQHQQRVRRNKPTPNGAAEKRLDKHRATQSLIWQREHDEYVEPELRIARVSRSDTARPRKTRVKAGHKDETPLPFNYSITDELALLDLHRSSSSDKSQLTIRFQAMYGPIISSEVAQYARLRLYRTHVGTPYEEQLALCRKIRRSFWKYVTTLEQDWRSQGKWFMHKQWRNHLAQTEGGEARSLRSMVECFVDEYCRRRLNRPLDLSEGALNDVEIGRAHV